MGIFGSLPGELGYQVSSVSLQVGLDTAWSIFSVLLMTLRVNKLQKQALCLCVLVRGLQLFLQLLLTPIAAVSKGVLKKVAMAGRMRSWRLAFPFCLASPLPGRAVVQHCFRVGIEWQGHHGKEGSGMSHVCRLTFDYLSRRVCLILSAWDTERDVMGSHPLTTSVWPELSKKEDPVLRLSREPGKTETVKALGQAGMA